MADSRVVNDSEVIIQVFSDNLGHSSQVLNPEGDRVLFSHLWEKGTEDFGAGGSLNFVKLLEYLGYTVYYEETF